MYQTFYFKKYNKDDILNFDARELYKFIKCFSLLENKVLSEVLDIINKAFYVSVAEGKDAFHINVKHINAQIAYKKAFKRVKELRGY